MLVDGHLVLSGILRVASRKACGDQPRPGQVVQGVEPSRRKAEIPHFGFKEGFGEPFPVISS